MRADIFDQFRTDTMRKIILMDYDQIDQIMKDIAVAVEYKRKNHDLIASINDLAPKAVTK